MTKNYYPQLPEVPYKKTSIGMPFVVAFAKTIIGTYGLEVVRTAYCIFRNESSNGQNGVNNNYAGIQADCGLWQGLTGAIATCVKVDNKKEQRRFICFPDKNGYAISFGFVCRKVKERGLFIGAPGINNPDGLAQAYNVKWVGSAGEMSQDDKDNFTALYKSAVKVFM